MGNCCVSGVLDLFLDWSNGDPRVLCHTLSIHPAAAAAGSITCATGCVAGSRADLSSEYELGEELGKGQFGVIRRCTHRSSGARLACKSIAKCKLSSPSDVRDVQREIDILRHLSGHPNVVQLKDVFEDESSVDMIMELCDGGELFDRIVQRRSFPEPEAARLFRTLIQVVSFCHDHGIIHRDLKPENILFCNEELKVADFGLAVRFQPGEVLSGMAGSAYYIAPEVLRGEYSQQVDVWSAGVVLYVMLSGVPPFWDETEEGIFDAIRYGHLDLSSEPWPRISVAAKDLIRGMLCSDVSRRLTPRQILEHEWVVKNTTESSTLRVSLPPSSRLDLSSSWRSWRTVASLSSSDSSSVGGASDDELEGEEEDGDKRKQRVLARWSSLTQVTEPNISEIVAVLFKDEDKPAVVLHSIVGSPKAGALVSSSKGTFLVVHDRQHKRIGWRQLHTSSTSSSTLPPAEAATAILSDDRLLWCPLPTGNASSSSSS